MRLSPEQIQFFRHNGFLKMPDRLPDEVVERLEEAIWRNIKEEIEPIVHNREGKVVRISNVWDREPIFREVIAYPDILEALEDLLGPNIQFIKNRHNHATLRLKEEGANYLHRDVMQWSRTIVTVIFYLEETTLENGCTHVIPGTHLLLGGSDVGIEKDEAIRKSGLLEQLIPVPMPSGGMLITDSMIIHGAGENRTDGTRISMTAGYHSVDELLDLENPKRVLVRGNKVYRGNDRS